MIFIKKIIFYYAMRTGRAKRLFIQYYKPSSFEFGAYLRKHGNFHHFGENTSINISATFTDPYYFSIGSNCALSACTLIGHDAVVNVIAAATGKRYDSVGKIVINDFCFIGHGAIIMPNITIGHHSIVAAGAVVTKDVPPYSVVGGVPAKFICSFDTLCENVKQKSLAYPWHDLVANRGSGFDPEIEPILREMRISHFYPNDTK